MLCIVFFFFSSRRRHTRFDCDWSSDVCSSDLGAVIPWLVGKVGDLLNHRFYAGMIQGETSWGQGIHYALIAAAFCYLYILFFALSGSKPNSVRYAKH